MTSKFTNETVTLHRMGKNPQQKTTNISTSKRYGGTRTNPEELKAAVSREIFQNKLPTSLRAKEPAKGEQAKEEKKTESKEEKEQISKEEQSGTIKKDETSNDLGVSELEQSDDEQKKKKQLIKEKNLEKELDQVIYISITETPTTILYYSPSTKYLTIKNDAEKAEEENKKKLYEDFLQKSKNKESFVKRGAQTINRFKSNQLVSTTLSKDADTEMQSDKVNCLNYVITDSIAEEKMKKDDISKLQQKKLDKVVKRELKQTLKNSIDMFKIDSSRSMQKSDLNESASLMDTFISSSLQSSRRPKPTRSNIGASQDKSNDKKSSPSSSFIRNSTNSELTDKRQPGPSVNSQHVRSALHEELPKSLSNALKFVERLLSQNKFHIRQIAYTDYPINRKEFEVKQKKTDDIGLVLGQDITNEEVDESVKNNQEEIMMLLDTTTEPNIKKWFTFSIDGLLKARNINSRYTVHSMDWNKNNEDLLAAAYGDPDINSKEPGFLCFWTLKNPLHPEKVIQTPRGLTYCNFSKKNPYYIVVSDYQGEIMIFDLRTNTLKPFADSSEVKDKHTDIVWECKWIERPNDKNEIIITTSSDGKMKEWSLKKNLEVTDLLKMKKSTSFPMKQLNPFANYLSRDREKERKDKESKEIKETLIFREANGLSFDFPKNDTTIYYVALEECTIHRCRISYKDQYTDNYYGHQGPVHKIRCNPFDPNILISCAYDWSIKIWNNKHNYPVMNLQTNGLVNQVNDIEWSNDTSTIFGCVADDGRIEIWDLARRAIQPIIIDTKDTVPKKSIKFSLGRKVVATGSSDGKIDVYRLYNLEHSPVSDEDQIARLQNVITQNSDISAKI